MVLLQQSRFASGRRCVYSFEAGHGWNSPTSRSQKTHMDTPPTAGPRKKKILVVDDNAIIVKTLAFKIKSQGYDVITAMDGSEAVSAVRREKPDLVVLDVSFPPDVGSGGGIPWDGFLIIEWLRRIDEAKNLPIVIISGGDAEKYEKKAKDAGAVAFFHKPVDHEGLIQVIRTTLGET